MLSAPVQKKKKSKNVVGTIPSKAIPTKKPTHLFFNDKCLTAIENIPAAVNLSVLYLHNNNINKIENLDAAINLKCLYLQKNKIAKIENLQHLENLQKLYIGHNEISVLEGLENLKNLKELHIEKQRLTGGDSLCFDSRTITSIGMSLEVLNISHNSITSIICLAPLKYIKYTNISYNKLVDLRDICDTIHNWYYLREASFIGNPVVKQRRYRESLISYTFYLSLLDNKEVSDTTRTFIKRFEQEKLNYPSKANISLENKMPELAKSYPLPVQKAISQAIMKNTKPCFEDTTTLHSNVSDIYLPWNALPKSITKAPRKHPGLRKEQSKQNKLSSMFPKFP